MFNGWRYHVEWEKGHVPPTAQASVRVTEVDKADGDAKLDGWAKIKVGGNSYQFKNSACGQNVLGDTVFLSHADNHVGGGVGSSGPINALTVEQRHFCVGLSQLGERYTVKWLQQDDHFQLDHGCSYPVRVEGDGKTVQIMEDRHGGKETNWRFQNPTLRPREEAEALYSLACQGDNDRAMFRLADMYDVRMMF
jgi:hypothetical protein